MAVAIARADVVVVAATGDAVHLEATRIVAATLTGS